MHANIGHRARRTADSAERTNHAISQRNRAQKPSDSVKRRKIKRKCGKSCATSRMPMSLVGKARDLETTGPRRW